MDLHNIYESNFKEEQFLLETHQKRFAFFSSICTAIFAGTIAGALKSDQLFHYFLLLIGPILIFLISHVGEQGTKRLYQRILENLTVRAKLEASLGLTKEISDDVSTPWPGESFIPSRHLESRANYNSSADFVEKQLDLGYQEAINRTFKCVKFASIVLAISLISVALYPLVSV